MSDHTAVILVALGGPGSLDDVGPFMTAFMGRPVPPPVLTAVRERYGLIGGKSPLVGIACEQACALGKELGPGFMTYAGFRHSSPSIAGACELALRDGAERIIAVSLSPYETVVTTGTYKKAFDDLHLPAFTFVPSFHNNRFFVQAWLEAVSGHPGIHDDGTAVIFTSHSIPVKYLEAGDPYKAQIEETGHRVAEGARLKHWFQGWQSKGARATEPWIEPEVESILDSLQDRGLTAVVEVPIGFTCDHLETLYDIDIVHKAYAAKLGLTFSRVKSLNSNPLFIRALADVARSSCV